MAKKGKNKTKIDYVNCIVEDRLLQVRNQKTSSELALVEVWSIKIQPQNSPTVLGIIREMSNLDPNPLQHVKRLQKLSVSELTVILCSKEMIEGPELESRLLASGVECHKLEIRQVPRHCPPTKELALEWGNHYWPLVWKGNPNDQVLNEMIFNMDHIKLHLRYISDVSSGTTNLPIVTAVVNPVDNTLVSVSCDEREQHPLNHSIMRCIQKVSEKELKRRNGIDPADYHYLCNDYHVYTTHEPCTMCAMALIHSRFARLIFLKRCSKTGAVDPTSGAGYTIHDHKLLNSKFECFQWLGSEYDIQNIDQCVNA